MLDVQGLNVSYGKVQALFDISLHVEEQEIIAIIGSNGAGKTTLMSTVVGLHKAGGGCVRFLGEDITSQPAHSTVRKGVVYVPEGRRIFYDLTVAENLYMGNYMKKSPPRVFRELEEEVLELFPKLRERLTQIGGTLSGGEQQMLAIARGLMGQPKLLMLDEPSLGLAPVIVDEMFSAIVDINKKKKIPILLVEQNAFMAMNIAARAYVLENGRITQQGNSTELMESPEVKRAYLG